jgi:hypothetical protein
LLYEVTRQIFVFMWAERGWSSTDHQLKVENRTLMSACTGTQHCSYSTHLPFICLVNHSWAVTTCSFSEAGQCPCSYRSGILNSHNWHQRADVNPHTELLHHYSIFQWMYERA